MDYNYPNLFACNLLLANCYNMRIVAFGQSQVAVITTFSISFATVMKLSLAPTSLANTGFSRKNPNNQQQK